jgi:hypothetical protein
VLMALACSRVCSRGRPCGIPFEEGPLAPSMSATAAVAVASCLFGAGNFLDAKSNNKIQWDMMDAKSSVNVCILLSWLTIKYYWILDND